MKLFPIVKFTLLAIFVQISLFLLGYYYCYDYIYPGSKAAFNINQSNGWFTLLNWTVSSLALIPNGFFISKLFSFISRVQNCRFPRPVIWFILLISMAICALLWTWGLWFTWPVGYIWHRHVWNTACEGWDLMVVLEGVVRPDFNVSSPVVGVVTAYFEHGTYTMEMALNSIESNHQVYEFYLKEAVNYTLPMYNITYNTTDWTYMVNGSTSRVIVEPSLQFPSLGLESYDPSIPFSSLGPATNLIRCNTSAEVGISTTYASSSPRVGCLSILETITLSPSNCSQLKVCGMQDETDNFQIALGAVMIKHFSYSLCCNGGCMGLSNVGDIRWADNGASSDNIGMFLSQDTSPRVGNSSFCPNPYQITSIGTCSWGLTGLGLCECPELQADPDIGGLGVILAFVITAGLTLSTSLLALFFEFTSTFECNFSNPVDQAVGRYIAQNFSFHSHDRRTFSSKTLRKLVLGFSDQQLVTGFSLLLLSFVHFRDGQISIYHFNLINDMAWFASNTHLITLTVLAEYLKANPVVRNWRLLTIIGMGGLLFATTILSSNESWTGALNCPALCLAQHMNLSPTTFDPMALLSIFIFIAGYLINTIPLFDGVWVHLVLLRRFTENVYERIKPSCGLAQTIHRFIGESVSWIFEFISSKIGAMIFHTVWFIIGIFQLTSDRINGQEVLGANQNENVWSFGQILALLLIVLNLFSVVEIYSDQTKDNESYFSDQSDGNDTV